MPLFILGTGHPRTGTTSMKVALEQLGFPCYHMEDVFANNDSYKWIQVMDTLDQGKSYDWEQILSRKGGKPYTAGVDAPIMCFYKELLKSYPDAKVILTVRDSAEVWYKSVMDTVYPANNDTLMKRLAELLLPGPMRYHRVAMKRMYWDHPQLMAGRFEEEEFAKGVYTKWNQEVQRVVPKQQLLVFNVKQGWAPLCEFLGVPVPATPFPRVNDTATFNARVERILGLQNMALLGMAAVATALVAAGAALLSRR